MSGHFVFERYYRAFVRLLHLLRIVYSDIDYDRPISTDGYYNRVSISNDMLLHVSPCSRIICVSNENGITYRH